jgi:hypothetical protein
MVNGELMAKPPRNRLWRGINHTAGKVCPPQRGRLGTVVAILAVADSLFQHRQWYGRQKMSIRKIKDDRAVAEIIGYLMRLRRLVAG